MNRESQAGNSASSNFVSRFFFVPNRDDVGRKTRNVIFASARKKGRIN